MFSQNTSMYLFELIIYAIYAIVSCYSHIALIISGKGDLATISFKNPNVNVKNIIFLF